LAFTSRYRQTTDATLKGLTVVISEDGRLKMRDVNDVTLCFYCTNSTFI